MTKRANQKNKHDRLWPIIVAQEPIIMAHDRISDPKKNYDRKNGTYCWSSLSRKNNNNIVVTHDRQ